jgi:hypothetical protein
MSPGLGPGASTSSATSRLLYAPVGYSRQVGAGAFTLFFRWMGYARCARSWSLSAGDSRISFVRRTMIA